MAHLGGLRFGDVRDMAAWCDRQVETLSCEMHVIVQLQHFSVPMRLQYHNFKVSHSGPFGRLCLPSHLLATGSCFAQSSGPIAISIAGRFYRSSCFWCMVHQGHSRTDCDSHYVTLETKQTALLTHLQAQRPLLGVFHMAFGLSSSAVATASEVP